MSNSSKPMRPDLPPAAVDRVFVRMTAIFGVQRMTAAWHDVKDAERHAVWAGAIGRAVWSDSTQRFDLDSIGAALDELADQPLGWPPTAGEFADRCARFAQRPGRNVLALPVPNRTPEQLAVGRERMDQLKAMLAKAIRPMPSGDAA